MELNKIREMIHDTLDDLEVDHAPGGGGWINGKEKAVDEIMEIIEKYFIPKNKVYGTK